MLIVDISHFYFQFLISTCISLFNTNLAIGSMHWRPVEKGVKKSVFLHARISFLGRVCESFVIRLRSRHSSPRIHIVVISVSWVSGKSARSRFTPLRTSSLTFRRATNPRTGNDWQPFRSQRISSSIRGTFARRKQFRMPKVPFYEPAVGLFDDTIYVELILRSEYQAQKKDSTVTMSTARTLNDSLQRRPII